MAAGDTLQGQRMPTGGDPVAWPNGGYGRFADRWFCKTPGGYLGDLTRHDVVEHEDGTLTVSPSILVSERRQGEHVELWHGYLERGVWREC